MAIELSEGENSQGWSETISDLDESADRGKSQLEAFLRVFLWQIVLLIKIDGSDLGETKKLILVQIDWNVKITVTNAAFLFRNFEYAHLPFM